MAKKRTMLHGYGKRNQELDVAGRSALMAGNTKAAAALFNKSEQVFRARRAVVGNGYAVAGGGR